MFYNRSALKQRAKQLVRQGNPPMHMITLVYILATTWLSTVCGLVVANPLNRVAEVMNSWSETITQTGNLSQGAMDALTQQIWACFRGPAAMAGLLAALILSFYSMVVALGYYGCNLRTMRGQESGGYRELFSHFDLAGKIILLQVLKFVFTYLWSLLFLIPGIVASYRYRLAEYCLIDDPDISALEAIRRSKALMRGRKGDLFVTDFSFFGWLLLQSLAVELVSVLIGSITAVPVLANLVALAVNTGCSMFLLAYQNLTYAGFYLFALGNQAPPVQDPNQTFDWQNHPQNPRGGDEGWNL